MQYYTNYIGYKQTNKKIGVIAVAPLLINSLPAIISLFSGLFGGGNEATKNINSLINSTKLQLENLQPRDRLGLLLAVAEQINIPSGRDYMVKTLFLWYKTNYINDYKTLLPEDKQYYNNFLNKAIQQNPGGTSPWGEILGFTLDGNGFKNIAIQSMFTNDEINYNQKIVPKITNSSNNVFSPNNVTSAINKTNSSATNNLLLYGGIGLGLLLILKKKKK